MDRSLGRWKKLLGIATFTTALAAAWLTPREAKAQHLMTPTGGHGQLAIDELSGFRIGALTGVQYAGPIGVAFQKYSQDNFAGGNEASSSYKLTTFWLAPAADYFVIDHLSIGGLLQIASTSGSVDTTTRAGITTTTNLQSATDFTILPRVGYLIPLGDRWGIWPRGGIGYASRQSLVTGNGRETFSGVYADIDVGFLGRLNETFFLMFAPDITFSLGGSHSADVGAGSVSANASFTQVGLLSTIGVFLDL